MPANEWDTDHAERYLARADDYPHRAEADAALLELVPTDPRRILDLGTGDGRVLRMVRDRSPTTRGIGLDVSHRMLTAARRECDDIDGIEILEHDLADELPDLGRFDAVVSSFAIHHLEHERKRALYEEILGALVPDGVFVNLEHVASPNERLHLEFLAAIDEPDDPSNRLLDVETQLAWLRELGYADVDCFWKWREIAVLSGRRPA